MSQDIYTLQFTKEVLDMVLDALNTAGDTDEFRETFEFVPVSGTLPDGSITGYIASTRFTKEPIEVLV